MFKDAVHDINLTVIAYGGHQKSTTGFPASFTKTSDEATSDAKAIRFVIIQFEYHESS